MFIPRLATSIYACMTWKWKFSSYVKRILQSLWVTHHPLEWRCVGGCHPFPLNNNRQNETRHPAIRVRDDKTKEKAFKAYTIAMLIIRIQFQFVRNTTIKEIMALNFTEEPITSKLKEEPVWLQASDVLWARIESLSSTKVIQNSCNRIW